MSDEELLQAVENPRRGDRLKIGPIGKVVDGNGRAYELKRRAADSRSIIAGDTEVTYEPYKPVKDYFYDLEE